MPVAATASDRNEPDKIRAIHRTWSGVLCQMVAVVVGGATALPAALSEEQILW